MDLVNVFETELHCKGSYLDLGEAGFRCVIGERGAGLHADTKRSWRDSRFGRNDRNICDADFGINSDTSQRFADFI